MNKILGIRHQQVAISYSAALVRLGTGDLLTVTILPQSGKQTAFECNLYARDPADLVISPSEIAELKNSLQRSISEFEAQQRSLVGGKGDFNNGK